MNASPPSSQGTPPSGKQGVNSAAMRVLDLMTPFGKGQRGLIVPPRGGKPFF
ncbi:MAG: hypothetical protein ACLSUW_01515 [Akkermansia sp.]